VLHFHCKWLHVISFTKYHKRQILRWEGLGTRLPSHCALQVWCCSPCLALELIPCQREHFEAAVFGKLYALLDATFWFPYLVSPPWHLVSAVSLPSGWCHYRGVCVCVCVCALSEIVHKGVVERIIFCSGYMLIVNPLQSLQARPTWLSWIHKQYLYWFIATYTERYFRYSIICKPMSCEKSTLCTLWKWKHTTALSPSVTSCNKLQWHSWIWSRLGLSGLVFRLWLSRLQNCDRYSDHTWEGLIPNCVSSLSWYWTVSKWLKPWNSWLKSQVES